MGCKFEKDKLAKDLSPAEIEIAKTVDPDQVALEGLTKQYDPEATVEFDAISRTEEQT